MISMATEKKFKDIRLKLHLSYRQLGALAGVSTGTVKKAETGEPILELSAYQIIEALNKLLPEEEQKLSLEDELIKIYKP